MSPSSCGDSPFAGSTSGRGFCVMKRCSRCKLKKSASQFTKRDSYCQPCRRIVWADCLLKKPLCSKCGLHPHGPNTTWCHACVRVYAAARRKLDSGDWYRKLTKEQKEKRSRRASLWSRVSRGKIIPKPCEVCGSLKVEGHHTDYAKEHKTDVRWLCKLHHAAMQRWEKLKLTKTGVRVDGKTCHGSLSST